MPRTAEEFKEVLLCCFWRAAYVCKKSDLCVCDVSAQMSLWQEKAETALATDGSGLYLVSSARAADTQSHGSPITHMGIVAL